MTSAQRDTLRESLAAVRFQLENCEGWLESGCPVDVAFLNLSIKADCLAIAAEKLQDKIKKTTLENS